MNLDHQIYRDFAISDLAAVPPEALNAGIDHMKVDPGLTKDAGGRFALWALLSTCRRRTSMVHFGVRQIVSRRGDFISLLEGAYVLLLRFVVSAGARWLAPCRSSKAVETCKT